MSVTPLHLTTGVAAIINGGILYPPVPALYTRPQSILEMIDHSLGRVLDLFVGHLAQHDVELSHDLGREQGGVGERERFAQFAIRKLKALPHRCLHGCAVHLIVGMDFCHAAKLR